MDEKSGASSIEQLAGCPVSAVSFVQDYVELHFDGLILGCFTLPVVRTGDAECHFGAPGYRDRLVAFIGKTPQTVREQDRIELSINFAAGESIKVSLRDEDAECAEAAMLHGEGISSIWP